MILKMLYILLTLTLLYYNKFESMPITLTQPDGTEFNAFLINFCLAPIELSTSLIQKLSCKQH